MSLLDVYSKGTVTGIAGPSVRRRIELEDTATNMRPDNIGTYGDTYADAILAAQRSGKNNLVSKVKSINAQQPSSKYVNNIATAANPRTNSLLVKAGKSNMLGPGHFPIDICTYTDRIFMEQNASLGQASINPSVLRVATQTVPVLTSIASNIGTLAGPPAVDGRYDITIGYGFVLYNTRGTYQG